MLPMKTMRLWHALIAVLAVAAHLTQGEGPRHQLPGYGVAAMIAIRQSMAPFGA